MSGVGCRLRKLTRSRSRRHRSLIRLSRRLEGQARRWRNQLAREVLATFPGHPRLCHGEPPGGFVDESSVDEFREFVAARWQALVRTAYLLVGDHGLAEDLVQTTLERVHRRWERIERRDQPEVYARRILINLAISWRRRRRVHEIPVAAVADASAGSDVEPSGSR